MQQRPLRNPPGVLPFADTGSPTFIVNSLRGELFRVAEAAVGDVVCLYAIRRHRLDSASAVHALRIRDETERRGPRIKAPTISNSRAWVIDVEIVGRRVDRQLGRHTFEIVGERIVFRSTYEKIGDLFSMPTLAARRRYREAIPLLYFEMAEKGLL